MKYCHNDDMVDVFCEQHINGFAFIKNGQQTYLLSFEISLNEKNSYV